MRFKLLSWNVNGLRSIYAKGFAHYFTANSPDILCLQETKISQDLLEAAHQQEGYSLMLSPAARAGYSGVASYIRNRPELKPSRVSSGLGAPLFDHEGRYLLTEHQFFTLYNVYVPSGTTGEERQTFKYQFLDHFSSHLSSLSPPQRSRLIICGDFNICHRPIDIHHPREAERRRLSGYLPEERLWMDKFLALGFVDAFRLIHGEEEKRYTWWSFRANSRKKNLGWRLDYFFVSKALAENIKQADIQENIAGSDHCPVTLEMEF